MIETGLIQSRNIALPTVFLAAMLLFNAAADAEPIEQQIGEAIASAQAADRLDNARAYLDRASLLLRKSSTTPGTRQMRLLKADLDRARGQVFSNTLKKHPETSELREEAQQVLNKALRVYERLHLEATRQANRLLQGIQPDQRKNSANYHRASALAARTIYSIGWTHYLMGTIQSKKEAAQTQWKQAISTFEDLTNRGFEEHPIVVESLIGTAMCHMELGDPHLAIKAVHSATPANTELEAFKRITILRIKAFSQLKLYYQITHSAGAYLAMRPCSKDWDPDELGIKIERASALAQCLELQNGSEYKDLYFQHFIEARDDLYTHDQPWIDRLIQKLGKTIDSGGYRSFLEARRLFAQEQFEDSSNTARRGLAESIGGGDKALHRELLYVIALASWNAKNWPRSFIASLEFIERYTNDERAHRLCVYAMQAARRVRRTQKHLPFSSLMQLYDVAEMHFNHLPEVSEVSWHRAHLLLETGQVLEAEQLLRSITKSSPMYWEAQYGLAMSALALSTTDNPLSARQHLHRATNAIQCFVDATPVRVPVAKQPIVRAVISLAINTTRAWLSQAPPEKVLAEQVLDKIAALPSNRSHVKKAEAALRLQIGVLNANTRQTIELISKVLATGSLHTEQAVTLNALADHLEHQFSDLLASNDPSRADPVGDLLTDLYTSLIDFHNRHSSGLHLGRVEVALRKRLGHAHNRMGRPDQALPEFLWLVEQVPPDEAADVLRGLAISYEGTGAVDEALSTWRKLKSRLRIGSDRWIETSIHLIACQIEVGNHTVAGKLAELLMLQAPHAIQGKWSNDIANIKEWIEASALSSNSSNDKQINHPTPSGILSP